MPIRGFALVYGIVFLAAGLSGFVPGLSPAHVHDGVTVTAASRLAMGIFPVNVIHNLVHIVFGIWGVAAARRFLAARTYARSVAIIYAVLTVMGLGPGANVMFGLAPLYGNDIWLHVILAAVAGFFGFLHREAVIDPATVQSRTAR
jgi:hypothetical protein